MDLRIIGIGIAVTFAIIALSAVTLYLTFRIKETFREDKGTKVQIAKIGFMIGILFLAGGLFYFFAQAITSNNIPMVNAETNNTNNTNIPLLVSSSKLNDTLFLEGGVLAQLKSPVVVNTPTVNITPAPTTQPAIERYYIVSDGPRSSSSSNSPGVPVIVTIPAPNENLSENNTTPTPTPIATPHNNTSTPAPIPTAAPTVTPNSTNTSRPTPSPTTPTPTLSPIPTPTPGHTPANTPTPAPTITVTATPTTTLTARSG